MKLAGVGKSFGDTRVLRDVDLEIRPGEFFSLLGPSGSGKTTTLRIIAGLETATDGLVYLDGTDATLLPPGDRDVAMVFQSYALYPHMTVFENIAFPLKMIRTPAARDRRGGAGGGGARAHRPSARAPPGPALRRPAAALRARAGDRAASPRYSCSTSRCPTSTPSCGSRRASS